MKRGAALSFIPELLVQPLLCRVISTYLYFICLSFMFVCSFVCLPQDNFTMSTKEQS